MSGTTANLNNVGDNFDTSNDSIVIVSNLETIPGGKTLDTTGFSPAVIPAGHLVIEETATGVLKPMPVSGMLMALASKPYLQRCCGIKCFNCKTICCRFGTWNCKQKRFKIHYF
jgi:hypothetical protein